MRLSMLEDITELFNAQILHYALWFGLISFALVFVTVFILRWFSLRSILKSLIATVRQLKKSPKTSPRSVKLSDKRLQHLWSQYVNTLHLPADAVDPASGMEAPARYRATLPAEGIFSSQSVYEGRIHTEFFKHLPGLLTGLGIIGTFVGLIFGLGDAMRGGKLNEVILINAVKEAFKFSASAIVIAMLITFVEKMIVAGLHRTVEELCQEIDALYVGGAGEEYLSRLARASEDSASNAGILKDELVDRLAVILERLSANQIAASARQQAELQQQLVSAIDSGLKAPLGQIAQGLGQFRSDQGEQLNQSLQDSMSAFADKLNELLGGQVGQAKELQLQTLQALEKAVVAFQGMATQVGSAGESATSAMSSKLTSTLDEMATRQTQMSDAMRAMIDEMRSSIKSTQADTSANAGVLMAQLGQQVHAVTQALQSEAQNARVEQKGHMAELATHTRQATDELLTGVRAQTMAIEQATNGMRNAVADLTSAVARNIEQVGQGAAQMQQAAERFAGAGRTVTDIFDQSKAVTMDLATAATTLARSSTDIQSVFADYRNARDGFAGLVAGLEQTIATAKRDAGMTSELVGRLQQAATVMGEAQRSANEYMGGVTDALTNAHATFSTQMLKTVSATTSSAHEQLAHATQMITETVHELDGALGDIRRAR
jgi:hypothetical protein